VGLNSQSFQLQEKVTLASQGWCHK